MADRAQATTIDDLEGRNFASAIETANILECDPRTVRSAIQAGKIPAVRVGAAYKIPVAWLRSAARLGAATAGGAA